MQTEKKKETITDKIKRLANEYKKLSIKKKTQYIAIALIIAVILAIYLSSITDKTKPEETAPQTSQASAAAAFNGGETEEKLKSILMKIEGAGKIEVMITYKSGPEIVPATLTDTQKNNTEDSGGDTRRTSESQNERESIMTVEKGGDENALILKEYTPEVKGVIVIAEGAGVISVKMNLLRAVQTILDISPEKIEIFEMKKG